MYSKTTNNINVSVEPYYLEEHSEPDEQHYVWAYQVTINNCGKQTVQLKKRFWKIQFFAVFTSGGALLGFSNYRNRMEALTNGKADFIAEGSLMDS